MQITNRLQDKSEKPYGCAFRAMHPGEFRGNLLGGFIVQEAYKYAIYTSIWFKKEAQRKNETPFGVRFYGAGSGFRCRR